MYIRFPGSWSIPQEYLEYLIGDFTWIPCALGEDEEDQETAAGDEEKHEDCGHVNGQQPECYQQLYM